MRQMTQAQQMEEGRPQGGIERAARLLGGEAAIHARVRNAMEAHDVLARGLPATALFALVDSVGFLAHGDSLRKAIGLSLRTLQRRRAEADPQALSVEQSNRAWRFAEIFAHAVDVLGSERDAEAWMNASATGLSNRRPVDLLATSAGAEAVEQHLTRMEYGVYT